MVEINNQRKAFLDMLAVGGTDNGRFKTRNHGYDVIVGGELFTDYSDHPRKLVSAKPKTQINRRQTLPASFPLVGCLPQAAYPKDSLRKVRTLWHCSRLRSVALSLWLIVVISVRQSTVAAISGLHCRALVMVSSEYKADSLIAKFKVKGGKRLERLMYEQSHCDYSALVICIIVCLAAAVNHYRDNAITHKAQRDKKCQRTEAGERGNYWHADALGACCCARCKIHEAELADAKAENDALRDDVAAGRRRLHIKVALPGASVKPSPPPADSAASPDWQTPLNGIIFYPQREADHYAKTTGRNPEVH